MLISYISCIHTYTMTYVHTCVHTHTHTHISTSLHTCTYAHKRTHCFFTQAPRCASHMHQNRRSQVVEHFVAATAVKQISRTQPRLLRLLCSICCRDCGQTKIAIMSSVYVLLFCSAASSLATSRQYVFATFLGLALSTLRMINSSPSTKSLTLHMCGTVITLVQVKLCPPTFAMFAAMRILVVMSQLKLGIVSVFLCSSFAS